MQKVECGPSLSTVPGLSTLNFHPLFYRATRHGENSGHDLSASSAHVVVLSGAAGRARVRNLQGIGHRRRDELERVAARDVHVRPAASRLAACGQSTTDCRPSWPGGACAAASGSGPFADHRPPTNRGKALHADVHALRRASSRAGLTMLARDAGCRTCALARAVALLAADVPLRRLPSPRGRRSPSGSRRRAGPWGASSRCRPDRTQSTSRSRWRPLAAVHPRNLVLREGQQRIRLRKVREDRLGMLLRIADDVGHACLRPALVRRRVAASAGVVPRERVIVPPDLLCAQHKSGNCRRSASTLGRSFTRI